MATSPDRRRARRQGREADVTTTALDARDTHSGPPTSPAVAAITGAESSTKAVSCRRATSSAWRRPFTTREAAEGLAGVRIRTRANREPAARHPGRQWRLHTCDDAPQPDSGPWLQRSAPERRSASIPTFSRTPIPRAVRSQRKKEAGAEQHVLHRAALLSPLEGTATEQCLSSAFAALKGFPICEHTRTPERCFSRRVPNATRAAPDGSPPLKANSTARQSAKQCRSWRNAAALGGNWPGERPALERTSCASSFGSCTWKKGRSELTASGHAIRDGCRARHAKSR